MSAPVVFFLDLPVLPTKISLSSLNLFPQSTVITFCLYLADPFTPYPVHADYSAIRVTPRDEDHMLRNLEMDESR